METQYYSHLCACGCGDQIEIKRHHKWRGIPLYVLGHNKSSLGIKRTEEQKRAYFKSKKDFFKNGGLIWNKGLTNETDFRVKNNSDRRIGQKRTNETRKKQSEVKKGYKRTIESRKKQSQSNKGRKVSEETKQKIRLGNIGKIVSEETKIKQAESQKGKHFGENNSFYGKKHTEETRQLMKANHADLKGKNNPNWNNGSSFEPYVPEFNKELKQFIKDRDFNTCQNPNCMETKGLCIHHIDYDKKNNDPSNLITLCRSCHSKTNSIEKREYFTEFYSEILDIYL